MSFSTNGATESIHIHCIHADQASHQLGVNVNQPDDKSSGSYMASLIVVSRYSVLAGERDLPASSVLESPGAASHPNIPSVPEQNQASCMEVIPRFI